MPLKPIARNISRPARPKVPLLKAKRSIRPPSSKTVKRAISAVIKLKYPDERLATRKKRIDFLMGIKGSNTPKE